MISASSRITALRDGYGKALVSGILAPTHRDQNLESGVGQTVIYDSYMRTLRVGAAPVKNLRS